MIGVMKKTITAIVAILFLIVSCIWEVSYVYAYDEKYYYNSCSYCEDNYHSKYYGEYSGNTFSAYRNPRHYEGDWGAMARKYALEAILYCITVIGGIWVKTDVSGKKLIECPIDPNAPPDYSCYCESVVRM